MKKHKNNVHKPQKRIAIGMQRVRASTAKTNPLVSHAKVQGVLDFTQYNPGSYVCPTCHLEFNPTVGDDVKTHEKYHNDFLLPPPFLLKPEWYSVIDESMYRYVRVGYTDSSSKAIGEMLRRVKEDLEMEMSRLMTPVHAFFICVHQSRAVGVVVSRILPVNANVYRINATVYDEITLSEQNRTEARIGVEMMWVHSQYRRRGIARHLLQISVFVNLNE